MFGLDLIYKIELKLQLLIKGRLTSLLLRMGVPQGSVLGPLLFLLYVNDIYSSSNKLNFYLFADDTNILYSHKNLKSLENVMNFELNNVFQWLTSHKLTLNLNKSNFVIFRPYQKRLPFVPNICILDHQTNTLTYLECKECVKYLGVLIDYKLSWKNHVDSIALKISKTIGLLSKLRHFVPYHTLVNIYNSLITPYLRYGLIVWGQASKTHLNKLLILQKRALRFIHFSDRRDHAIPLFSNAHILSINFMHYKLLAETMHDMSNDLVPSNLKDLFVSTAKIHLTIHEPRPLIIFISRNQILKLRGSPFQELVQNCGMRYQLS